MALPTHHLQKADARIRSGANNIFYVRTIRDWNKLPQDVKSAHAIQPLSHGAITLMCVHYRLNWARRSSWGWWDDTSLQTQDSNPGSLRPSTLPLIHGGSPQCPPDTGVFNEWMGKKHFCFFQTAETGNELPILAWKAAVLTTTLGPPPLIPCNFLSHYIPMHIWYDVFLDIWK